LIVFSAAVVVVALSFLFQGGSAGDSDAADAQARISTVVVNDVRVRVSLAQTTEERNRGLGGWPSLEANEGMLFLFPKAQPLAFWMKDMLFPIDMIWIRDRLVVDVSRDVPLPEPGRSLPTYSPTEPADAVLEVLAGFAKAHGVAAGMPVEYFCLAPGIDADPAPC
jgi:uncharacterized membrane protein (UPF0127 family)